MSGEWDVVIIGGGPAGYVAAIRAAQLGARVALVEGDRLGGLCLNRGCIPTKTLIRSVEVLLEVEKAAEFGVLTGEPDLNFRAMMARKAKVVGKLVSGVEELLRARKVEVVRGWGRLAGPGRVRVEGKTPGELAAPAIIIATGSLPLAPPIPGAELPGVLMSDELLEVEEPPESLVVIGGGVVGVELAGLFSALGCRVSLLEMLPRLILPVDGELARRLQELLRQQGVQVRLQAKVTSIEGGEDGLRVRFQSPAGEGQVEAEKVLLAIGRVPNIEGLGLEEVGVRADRRGIGVDGYLETNVPGIYAIGDVTGGPMLAHLASRAGEVAAENALGPRNPLDRRAVPVCVYSLPEMAGVGLTEEEAREQGLPYRKSRFPFRASGRALTLGEERGLVKMLCEEGSGRVLGVHILGPHASELIAEATLALRLGATARDIATTIHAHPTLSEALMEAAWGQLEGAIHAL